MGCVLDWLDIFEGVVLIFMVFLFFLLFLMDFFGVVWIGVESIDFWLSVMV